MLAPSKLVSLAVVLFLTGPAMVSAQPDGEDPAQVSVASPTCIDHRGSPPGSGSITLADVGETPEGQRVLVETVSGAQAPDCGLGPIQPCDEVQDPDAFVYVDTTVLCARNSSAASSLCDFQIFLDFASASQASKCYSPEVPPIPDECSIVDSTPVICGGGLPPTNVCEYVKSTPVLCEDPGPLPDECSVISTIPVLCDELGPLPDECSIVTAEIPVLCDDLGPLPGECSVVAVPVLCDELGPLPDECSIVTAEIPVLCDDLGPVPDECSIVTAEIPVLCDEVGGIDTNPCSHLNVNGCDDGRLTHCDVAPAACDEVGPIHIPNPGPGPWDCVNGVVHLDLKPMESSQSAAPDCKIEISTNPCDYYAEAPTCDGEKPDPCDHVNPLWASTTPIICDVGPPDDACSLLNIPDQGGNLPCGLSGPDPCDFAPEPPENPDPNFTLPCGMGVPQLCSLLVEAVDQPDGDGDLPCGLSGPDPCDLMPPPPEDPMHEVVLPCGMGVQHPCSIIKEEAEMPEGPLPCADDPCAEDPDCRHFDPCETLSPVLSGFVGIDCGDPIPTCDDVAGWVGQDCDVELCETLGQVYYSLNDCTVPNPCDELERGIAVPGGRWSPVDCGSRICGEGGMEDTMEQKEPTEVVGCLLPPICVLEGIEECYPNVGPPGAPTDPCVGVDMVHAVVSGQVGADLCGKASQVVECSSVVPPLPPETPCITYRLNGEVKVMAPDMPAVYIQGEPELREETAEFSANPACAPGTALAACPASGYEYDSDNVVAVLWWIGAPVLTPNVDPEECSSPPCVDINGAAGTFLVIPGPAAPSGMSMAASAQIHTVEMGFEVNRFQPGVMVGDARFHGRLLGDGATEMQIELQDPDTVDVELALVSPSMSGDRAAFARFGEAKFVRLAQSGVTANQGFAGRVHYDANAPIQDPTKGQTVGDGTQVVVDWTTTVAGPLTVTVNDYVVNVQNAPRKITGAEIGVIHTPDESFFGIHWPGEQSVALVDVTTPHTGLLQFAQVPPSFDGAFHLYDGPDPAFPNDPNKDPWQFVNMRYSAAGSTSLATTDVVVEFNGQVKVQATDISPDLQVSFARANPETADTDQLVLLEDALDGVLLAPGESKPGNALPPLVLGVRNPTADAGTNVASRVEVTVGDTATIVVRDVEQAYIDTRAFVNLGRSWDGLDVSFGDNGHIFVQIVDHQRDDTWDLTLAAERVDMLGNLYLAGRTKSDLRVLADVRVANNLPEGMSMNVKVDGRDAIVFDRIQAVDLDMDLGRDRTTLHAIARFGTFKLEACAIIGCSGTLGIDAQQLEEITIQHDGSAALADDFKLMWSLDFDSDAHLTIRSGFVDADVQPGTYTVTYDTCFPEYTPGCGTVTETINGDQGVFDFKDTAAMFCPDFTYVFDRNGETFSSCMLDRAHVGTHGPGASSQTGTSADAALQEVEPVAASAEERARPEELLDGGPNPKPGPVAINLK